MNDVAVDREDHLAPLGVTSGPTFRHQDSTRPCRLYQGTEPEKGRRRRWPWVVQIVGGAAMVALPLIEWFARAPGASVGVRSSSLAIGCAGVVVVAGGSPSLWLQARYERGSRERHDA